MNCKPGDLAIVVGPVDDEKWLGKILRVLHLHQNPELGPCWLTDCDKWNFTDASLRPIRDPGDDAVDETLREREAA